MSENRFELDRSEGESLRSRILSNLPEAPAQTDENVAEFGDRPIWEEMFQAGLLSENARNNLARRIGPSLGNALNATRFNFNNSVTPKVRDHLRDYIRLSYGFDPQLPIPTPEREHQAMNDDPALVELEEQLTALMTTPMDFNAVGLSKVAVDRLAAAGLATVGDLFVAGNSRLTGDIGLTRGAYVKLRDHIEAAHDISFEAIRTNRALTDAIAWKRAILKATQA